MRMQAKRRKTDPELDFVDLKMPVVPAEQARIDDERLALEEDVRHDGLWLRHRPLSLRGSRSPLNVR